jgi:hypothetical protein
MIVLTQWFFYFKNVNTEMYKFVLKMMIDVSYNWKNVSLERLSKLFDYFIMFWQNDDKLCVTNQFNAAFLENLIFIKFYLNYKLSASSSFKFDLLSF